MVNQDILGALHSALARGESIEKAKQSLYNSGYSKQDIELAANNITQVPRISSPVQKSREYEEKTNNNKKEQVIQAVSKYESLSRDSILNAFRFNKLFVFFLIIVLVLLFGLLIGLIIMPDTIKGLFA